MVSSSAGGGRVDMIDDLGAIRGEKENCLGWHMVVTNSGISIAVKVKVGPD